MKRYHEELPRTRRVHRLHLRWVHHWPKKPVDCICDHQVGRFRKHRALACEKRQCMCKADKIFGRPTTRDLRRRQEVMEALREYESCVDGE